MTKEQIEVVEVVGELGEEERTALEGGVWRNIHVQLLDGTCRIHVCPVFPGERTHDLDDRCWCEPVPDSEEPRVIVHRRRPVVA